MHAISHVRSCRASALLLAGLLGVSVVPAMPAGAQDATPPAGCASATPAPPATETPPGDGTAPAADALPTSDVEAPPADDAEEAPVADDFRDRLLVVGLRAGIGVPSLFNELGVSYDLSLEVGMLLPFLDGRLAISADVGYSAPTASGSGTDARVGASGGTWTYDVTNERLVVSLGPVFRFLPPGSAFVPYVGLLGRMYLVRSTATGTGAGQPFGENVETSTAFGVVGALGGELLLGPGAALLEVSLGWAGLEQKITGSTTAGVLAVQLGYRLFL